MDRFSERPTGAAFKARHGECKTPVAPMPHSPRQLDEKSTAPSQRYQIQREGNAIRFCGDLQMRDAAPFWRELHQQLGKDVGGPLVLDLSNVSIADGGIVALLIEFRNDLERRGVKAELAFANERVETIIALYSGHDIAIKRKKRKPEGIVAQIGRATIDLRSETKDLLSFLGDTAHAGISLLRNPRGGHWKEVAPLCERAGANAVPVVLLINFLVGCVMAFQSAKQLKMYGANVYVADLVGISMTRELSPLMTAIIVCGRSGAAFTAEIGSMKVNYEIDALRTLGLSPFGWLVIPRIMALVFVVPLLTLMADCVGIAGGLLVGVVDLELTVRGYAIESLVAIHGSDIATGLLKSVAFSLVIALVACQQGFAVSGGAEGVGRRTTTSVVASLFLLVMTDALLTLIFRALNV